MSAGPVQPGIKANLINFPAQILDLLIFCADTCSHTIFPANSQGTCGGLVYGHFTKPRQIPYLFFFLVTIVTLYPWGDSWLICSLGMQIPSLSFAIENANTFSKQKDISETLTNVHKIFDIVCSRCSLNVCYLSNLGKASSIRYMGIQTVLLRW